MHVRDCSCAPILRFFYAASDGATANRQIPDRIFGRFYQFEEDVQIMRGFGRCFAFC